MLLDTVVENKSELDERILAYYIMSVNRLDSDGEDTNTSLSKEMGYLGSVEATKKKLESLFNKS